MPQPPPTEAQQGPQQCTLYSLYSLYSNQTQGNISIFQVDWRILNNQTGIYRRREFAMIFPMGESRGQWELSERKQLWRRVVEINDLSNIDWMYWQFLGEGGLGQSLWLLAQTFYTWVIHNWLAGDLIVWSLPWGPRRVLLILFRVLVESLLTSSLEFMCLQDINKEEREVINI